ncbi:MAG TPA: STAS domain-containing protein [Anaerolineales bacterium]|nr:STAS domain-containing protein [Anaerolineales bacterium]HMR97624.1 STAS domain-containing protein [Anaerolineales bacterium]HNQ93042.1 STAS domain-containing protein [Anaerolineales bacterium]HNS61353.1 STAS domain-containing protein [Anaerolineales bacterium]
MEIVVSKQTSRVEVTIVGLSGEVDGQNFQQVIDKARELYAAGARDFLVDMSSLTYISSAGLVAIHSIALLVRGEPLPDTESGWSAYRSMGKTREIGKQQHIKLSNPNEQIRGVLEMVGFDSAFEIFSNLDDAVRAF